MKRLGDILRFSLVSIEFGGVVCALVYWQWGLSWLRELGALLQSDADSVKFLYVAPAAILAYSIAVAKKTLRPSDEAGPILAEWPGLHMLENRVYLSIAINFAATVASALLWLKSKSLDPNTIGLLVTLIFYLMIVSTGSLLLAEYKIQRTLDASK